MIAILNKVGKGDLTEEVTFELRPIRGKLTVWLSVQGVHQVAVTVGAKVLGQDHAWLLEE